MNYQKIQDEAYDESVKQVNEMGIEVASDPLSLGIVQQLCLQGIIKRLELKIKELEQTPAGTDPAVEAYIDRLEHTNKALQEEIIKIKDLSKESIIKEIFIDTMMKNFNDDYGRPMYTAAQISLICGYMNDLHERLFGEKGAIQCR